MRRQTTHSGSSALDWDFEPNENVYVKEIRVKLSGQAGNDYLVISVDSTLGSGYDVVKRKIGMAGVTDIIWTPDGEGLYILKGDKLNFAWPNDDDRTYSIEVQYS